MGESEEIALRPPHLQWVTVAPGQGESIRGWVAGPIKIHTCHFVNKASRACRDKYTKGAFLCYCAKTPMSARQLGYLPIITREREKRVILMCATTAKTAKLLELGQPVEFSRPKKDKSGLRFRVLIAGELGEAAGANMKRIKPHDIREYLLRVLWQDTELIRFVDKTELTSTPTCEEATVTEVKYPPLVRRGKARDNTVSLTNTAEGIGAPPDAA